MLFTNSKKLRLILGFALLLLAWMNHAQADEHTTKPNPMTEQRLQTLIHYYGQDVVAEGSMIGFSYAGTQLMCISDVTSDRMRIVSPIADLEEIELEQLFVAMAANFHSVLDARYAISEDTLYSAFIHPLSSLTEDELVSAIRQVANARITFGTEYSSGELFFGGEKQQP